MAKSETDYELPRILRSLAEAIEKRRDAYTFPGTPCPSQIAFYDGGNRDQDTALMVAVKREVRLTWDELRDRALKRLDVSVAQLTHQAIELLARADTEKSEPEEDTHG